MWTRRPLRGCAGSGGTPIAGKTAYDPKVSLVDGARTTRFEVLSRWRVSIVRTAPDSERIDSEWVVAVSAE